MLSRLNIHTVDEKVGAWEEHLYCPRALSQATATSKKFIQVRR